MFSLRGFVGLSLLWPAVFAAAATGDVALGDWAGILAQNSIVVVHVRDDGHGSYRVDVEDPDDPRKHYTDAKPKIVAERMHVALSNGASVDATWNAREETWQGTWTQGATADLVLRRLDERGVAALIPPRPQERSIAEQPHSYISRDARIVSTPETKLVGTLTLPTGGGGPFPAIVLLSGSGRTSRDERIAFHSLFLVLADALARRGFAVLRYDKRGVGASHGDYANATTDDFVDDAVAAFDWLETQNEIERRQIGVLGHSEGGMVATLAARRRPIAFAVLLATPAVRGDQILIEQTAALARASNQPAEAVAAGRRRDVALYSRIAAAPTTADARAAVLRAVGQSDLAPKADAIAIADHLTTPWFRHFLTLDPRAGLQAMHIPVLAIVGSNDLQVPPVIDVPALRSALASNPQAKVIEVPGLNHLLQKSKTGLPSEYFTLEQTIDPETLQMIAAWAEAAAGESDLAR